MNTIGIINYAAVENCIQRLNEVIEASKNSDPKDNVTERLNMEMVGLKRALNDLKLGIGDISTGQHNINAFEITKLEVEVRKYNRASQSNK